MSKKKKKPTGAMRMVELASIVADKRRPKKERKAARAELDALKGAFVPSEATGDPEAEPSSPSIADAGPSTSPADSGSGGSDERGGPLGEKQDAEVARQWAHFHATKETADAARLSESAQAIIDEADRLEEAEAPVIVIEAPIPFERIEVDADGVIRFKRPEGTMSGKEAGQIVLETAAHPPQEAVEVETDHGREFAVGSPKPESEKFDPWGPEKPEDVLAKPADPVLENGNGQPIIHYIDPSTGREKSKGYTRVTTYIKGLEDTSVLEKWKMRTLLEGAAVEAVQLAKQDSDDTRIQMVARAVKRLDEALADIDRREKIEGELLHLRRAELVKEHKDHLDRVAEDLLELGGAHEKANKGTDLHRLTEIVDNGQPLPEGTTASDRRDVEAYQETMERLGIQTLWTERRIVLDDLQVSGTMDRAYLYKPTGGIRRARVVGDLKTGSITWGAGKIGMQLALYARGLGYDWTKPLERERLGLSQRVGLLVHLPQGEGTCSVYEVDLELAGKGLALAREVREWRNTGKRVFDLKKPLGA